MCLLIGPTGVGKTVLLKRLQVGSLKGNYIDLEELPHPANTVGADIVNITNAKKQEIKVKELGGEMAPSWKDYYKETSAIIFMVDMSCPTQISASSILLLEMLAHPSTQQAAVLIVLNKIDKENSMKRDDFDSVLQMDAILKYVLQQVSIISTSSVTGEGLAKVMRWIQSHV